MLTLPNFGHITTSMISFRYRQNFVGDAMDSGPKLSRVSRVLYGFWISLS